MSVLQKSTALLFATFFLAIVCAGQTMNKRHDSGSEQPAYFGRVQGDIQYYGLTRLSKRLQISTKQANRPA